MHLVHDQMRITLERLWIIHKPHQENSSCHKRYLGDTWSFLALHPNMIANCLSDPLLQLRGYSPSNIDGCEASRLRANHLDILLPMESSLKDILGHLSRLSATSVS